MFSRMTDNMQVAGLAIPKPVIDRGWNRTLRKVFAILMCLAMALCSQISYAQSHETLGEGDSVRITVFQNPDLTTETRISERGTITFPLVGEVMLAGLTPADAETRIARRLADGKYVLKAQVNLNVTRVRSRQVSVLGHVVRPGRYALDDTSSKLADILALAGGISPTGDDNVGVTVTRHGKIQTMQINVPGLYRDLGDPAHNIQVQGGDMIFVQRAPVFYIYGEVQRAGSYRLESLMTVMQAISTGGGITPRGTQRGVSIQRKSPDGKLLKINASLVDALEPGDVVYVPESLF